LPGATTDTSYSYRLQAEGGAPPFRWTLAGGVLPAGLLLDRVGNISGTPTKNGTFEFAAGRRCYSQLRCRGKRRFEPVDDYDLILAQRDLRYDVLRPTSSNRWNNSLRVVVSERAVARRVKPWSRIGSDYRNSGTGRVVHVYSQSV
jgi:hypothetical protein